MLPGSTTHAAVHGGPGDGRLLGTQTKISSGVTVGLEDCGKAQRLAVAPRCGHGCPAKPQSIPASEGGATETGGLWSVPWAGTGHSGGD